MTIEEIDEVYVGLLAAAKTENDKAFSEHMFAAVRDVHIQMNRIADALVLLSTVADDMADRGIPPYNKGI
jgi:hypothetical protein